MRLFKISSLIGIVALFALVAGCGQDKDEKSEVIVENKTPYIERPIINENYKRDGDNLDGALHLDNLLHENYEQAQWNDEIQDYEYKGLPLLYRGHATSNIMRGLNIPDRAVFFIDNDKVLYGIRHTYHGTDNDGLLAGGVYMIDLKDKKVEYFDGLEKENFRLAAKNDEIKNSILHVCADGMTFITTNYYQDINGKLYHRSDKDYPFSDYKYMSKEDGYADAFWDLSIGCTPFRNDHENSKYKIIENPEMTYRDKNQWPIEHFSKQSFRISKDGLFVSGITEKGVDRYSELFSRNKKGLFIDRDHSSYKYIPWTGELFTSTSYYEPGNSCEIITIIDKEYKKVKKTLCPKKHVNRSMSNANVRRVKNGYIAYYMASRIGGFPMAFYNDEMNFERGLLLKSDHKKGIMAVEVRDVNVSPDGCGLLYWQDTPFFRKEGAQKNEGVMYLNICKEKNSEK